jgi:hypothetical protein
MQNASYAYGLGIDKQGNIWCSSYGINQIIKYSPEGTLLAIYAQGAPYAQGITVSPSTNDVWVAQSNSRSVGHLKNDGSYVGTIGTAQGIIGDTRGIATDAKGFVWVTTASGYIHKIDPDGGPIGSDGATHVGAVVWTSPQMRGVNDIGIADLYTYSDMTGSTLTAPPNRGTWSAVFDSGQDDTEWGIIDWKAVVPADGSMEVFASFSVDGVDFSIPILVENGKEFDFPPARYIKTEVRLYRSSGGESPVVDIITIRAKESGWKETDKNDGYGVKIPSNAHSYDAGCGVVFYWDVKQKDEGKLVIPAEYFATYKNLTIVVKSSSEYRKLTVTKPGVYDITKWTDANGKEHNINMVWIRFNK